MGILEKISEIEKEISRTQKNKGKNMSKFYEIYAGPIDTPKPTHKFQNNLYYSY